MRLWILKARDGLSDGDDPWGYSPFDKINGLVVRAESEERARNLAQASGKDEIRQILAQDAKESPVDTWLSPRYSTCEELPSDGDEGVILVDSLML